MPDTDAPKDTPFSQVPVEVIVSVGRARPRIGELLRMEQHAVLQLDRKVEDPVELFVGDRLIARGELVEQDAGGGQLAVRILEIADPGRELT
ncbi:flagellar motor switch protein FliN/FliY [Aliiruegeria haliotis]|uniref:Flagellar motor switch protein FliN/FliY n=1 Tax=Aliiruegeria haliotis TaxID=1280846 RepID=A0A2T0RTL0_9RHOB|nr:FliM/FliN family flagellar motor switch protein [Aliiruegeria haliotis]PRY24413.1 flagellar motor switch protein FliN/FliY [Aliiruegeria haliotis]